MPEFHLIPLAVPVIVCVVFAVAGNVWVGDGLKTWYPQLVKPKAQAPLWAFFIVAATVYLIEGMVLYRLLIHVATHEGKVVSVTALFTLMAYNEAWNYSFFGLRSTLAALVGMVGFVAPLVVLMTALFAYEPTSGWMMTPYCAWVAYDVWWVYQLWRLNDAVD